MAEAARQQDALERVAYLLTHGIELGAVGFQFEQHELDRDSVGDIVRFKPGQSLFNRFHPALRAGLNSGTVADPARAGNTGGERLSS